MRKPQTVPYTLLVVSDKWTGNFERELIGYSMGILDEVQLDIDFADEERMAFWKEVYNMNKVPEYPDEVEGYDIMDKYLLETYQDVDDWSQMTFYNVSGWENEFGDMPENTDSIIKIQLNIPLDERWEEIIIPRMKKFFEIYKSYRGSATGRLLALRLYNTEQEGKAVLIKDYLS